MRYINYYPLSLIIIFICVALSACTSIEEIEKSVKDTHDSLNLTDGVNEEEALNIARYTALEKSLPLITVPNDPVESDDYWIFDIIDEYPTTYESLERDVINWSDSYLVSKKDGRVKTLSVPDLEILGIDREPLREIEMYFQHIDSQKSLNKKDAIITTERYIYIENYKIGLNYEVPHNPTSVGNNWIFELEPRQNGLGKLTAHVSMLNSKIKLQNENHQIALQNFRDIDVSDGVDRDEALVILQYYYFAKNDWYTVWEDPELPVADNDLWVYTFKLPPGTKYVSELLVTIHKETGKVIIYENGSNL